MYKMSFKTRKMRIKIIFKSERVKNFMKLNKIRLNELKSKLNTKILSINKILKESSKIFTDDWLLANSNFSLNLLTDIYEEAVQVIVDKDKYKEAKDAIKNDIVLDTAEYELYLEIINARHSYNITTMVGKLYGYAGLQKYIDTMRKIITKYTEIVFDMNFFLLPAKSIGDRSNLLSFFTPNSETDLNQDACILILALGYRSYLYDMIKSLKAGKKYFKEAVCFVENYDCLYNALTEKDVQALYNNSVTTLHFNVDYTLLLIEHNVWFPHQVINKYIRQIATGNIDGFAIRIEEYESKSELIYGIKKKMRLNQDDIELIDTLTYLITNCETINCMDILKRVFQIHYKNYRYKGFILPQSVISEDQFLDIMSSDRTTFEIIYDLFYLNRESYDLDLLKIMEV